MTANKWLQAMVLVPRYRLQDFIERCADFLALISIVVDNHRNCPDDANVLKHMLNIMNKALDNQRLVRNCDGHVPAATNLWDLIGPTLLEVGWESGDIPLCHKVIRYYVSGGTISDDLVARLAHYVNQLTSTPQRTDWDRWFVCLTLSSTISFGLH